MATTTASPETAAASPTPAKIGIMPILISVLLAVLVAVGAVAGVGFWFVHSGRLAKLMPGAPAGAPAAAEHAHVAEAATAPDELPPTHVLALEPLVVNLSDPGGRAYLRATISLRLQDEPKKKDEKGEKEGAKNDKAAKPSDLSLRDTTLSVLASQTSDQLLATGGLDALKKHLRQTYALQNVDQHVIDVYVTDFLVQRG